MYDNNNNMILYDELRRYNRRLHETRDIAQFYVFHIRPTRSSSSKSMGAPAAGSLQMIFGEKIGDDYYFFRSTGELANHAARIL